MRSAKHSQYQRADIFARFKLSCWFERFDTGIAFADPRSNEHMQRPPYDERPNTMRSGRGRGQKPKRPLDAANSLPGPLLRVTDASSEEA
jgi:hypothetical protein